MRLPISLVDAFADGPFTGNPAGVVVLETALDEGTMQKIAMEMNQAETAFLWPLEGDATSLRWFTPTVEVDLCGHATLASAHVLFSQGYKGSLRFSTRSGMLTAERNRDRIVLDFPSEAPEACALPHSLAFLGEPLWTGKNRMDWFVQIPDEALLRQLEPDFGAIAALGMRGLIVTAAGKDVDFVSRFFAPQSGVPEDAVTGSAHCALAPFWSDRLAKGQLTAFQASPRGGTVGTTILGERILLEGKAVTTLEGHLQF